ncbi:MAG: alpha-L-fucosidase [Candidatus Hydrogenedentes bacterium]|nr:alpha-L-fucosidase [Candidatus Hydrogenedentota bacterium]
MAIIHQPQLFSWNEIEARSDLQRLRMVVETLPDEALMQALEAERKGRRDDYPLRAVWNSLLAGLVFQHPTIESLRRELRRNAELRQVCGFDVFEGADAVPPSWVYTRLLKKLLGHLGLVEAMFEELVTCLQSELAGLGTRLAVDSKALPSFGRKPAEDKRQSPDGRRDTDADWGTKTYKGIREDGSAWEKVKRWFGYKVHLRVDADYELPLAFCVTRASAGDSPELPKLLDHLDQAHPQLTQHAQYLSADKAWLHTGPVPPHTQPLRLDDQFPPPRPPRLSLRCPPWHRQRPDRPPDSPQPGDLAPSNPYFANASTVLAPPASPCLRQARRLQSGPESGKREQVEREWGLLREGIAMPDTTSRRGFLKRTATVAAVAAGAVPLASCARVGRARIPSHLAGNKEAFMDDPRQAAAAWFREAEFGLFMHYGLYSLLARGEWVMLKERIPVGEYAKLKARFTAERFDADAITDLALAAGMRYVNITSKHHDGFCLFRTAQTDFNSVEAPARRDLIGELASACSKKGLGLFLYYSYGADWRHPYFYAREAGWPSARPAYETPEPTYLWKEDADFARYVDFVHNQLRELLTQYGPLAGIWFDPIMGYYSRPDLFPIEQTYALVRSIQPHCLISFKQGANGDEDFAAPERKAQALDRGGDVAARAWERNKDKPIEICDTLQPRVWGYNAAVDSEHRSADEVMQMLADAAARNANLLLNTGPLGDGSIHPVDEATLREVGRRLA